MNLAAAVQLDDEVFALLACAARSHVSDLNGVVPAELVPPAPIELVRRRPLESQQSAHVVRGAVALLALVEEKRLAASPSQHERCAHSRGATSDDNAVPILVRAHPMSLAGLSPR